jgi:lipoprotein-releasing system permease protein
MREAENGMGEALKKQATAPFSPFEWLLSLRYLRARRREGFISVIAGFSFVGIMLGVATLIIVMSVMNGFRIELLGKILGLNGHMMVRGYTSDISDFDARVASISQVDGVTYVSPLVEGQVMASSANGGSGALVRGIREEDLKALSPVSGGVLAGSLDGFDEGGGVAIGSRLARSLGLRLGDNVTLLSPRGASTPFGTAPRVRSYPIKAVFEVGMSEYDASFIFMPLADAQSYFKTGEGAVTAIEVKIENPDEVRDFILPVSQAAGPSLQVYTWQQLNQSFFSALQVERNVMFLILTLILLVASLNIVSGLIMLVKDKGRDIAVLRTMGASRGSVMRVFFITGASIGVSGTLAGFVLGLVFCLNIENLRQGLSNLLGTELFSPEIYFLSRLPAVVEPGEVMAVVGMSLFLSVVATLYPSWRAASLDPVEALRYE